MPVNVEQNNKPSIYILGFVALYVAIVLLVDTLTALGIRVPIDWRHTFHWVSPNGFDWFKFLAWFVIPFALSLRGMDWGYLGFNRWKRWDWFLLLGLAGAGCLAVLIIPHIPGLQNFYPSMSHLTWPEKREFLGQQILWNASWLVGWEFMHRYFLLRPFAARWPRFGWLIVPFSEGLYHLQKHPAETAGMVAISVILTWWALRRRNATLPFLAHLTVEVELILFLVLA